MKKKYAIYFATLVLSAVLQQTWSQSQQHVWYFGNQKIDFDVSPLAITQNPSMGAIIPTYANDGAHDQQGRMVLNITDDKVYNKFGNLIGTLDVNDYSSPENVIIPFPNSTCKFIILSTYSMPVGSNYTYAYVVDLSANNNQGTITSTTTLSTENGKFRDMVVGRLNSNNERFFYLLNVKQSFHDNPNIFLQSFKISSSGNITLVHSQLVPNIHLDNETITDSELSFNGNEINVVDGSKYIYRIYINPLDGSINTNAFSFFKYDSDYNGITSIERTPNGNVFYSNTHKIGCTDLNTEFNLGLDFNQANCRLELTSISNKILAVNPQGVCHLISNIDLNPSIQLNIFPIPTYPNLNVGVDNLSGLVHIPKQIDGEDYLAKYANGSSIACCNFDSGIDAINLSISANTTWSNLNPYTISGTVDVTSGTLTILNSNIKFTETGKIIVRPGAKLKVLNSTLTSTNCGDFWKGIEVQGNSSLTQASNSQGELWLDNSTIENALQGVSLYGLNGNQTDWSKTGGKIISMNSTFKNNRKDVAFLSYSFTNNSKFTNTKFLTTQALQTGVNPGWHVTMYDVTGVIFEGCEFSNTNSSSTVFTRGSGIKSIDSKFVVTALSNPGNPLIHASFNNLDSGIDATGTNQNQPLAISYSNFNDVIRGVQLTGVRNSKIYENTIHLNETIQGTIGINLQSCERHEVENNAIYGHNDNLSFGILIDNSNLDGLSKATNLVYRNALHDLEYGITTFNANAALDLNPLSPNFQKVLEGTGLVFKCNRFYNGITSDITANGPVAINQGICSDLLHDPSNNLFSIPPTSQADIWYAPTDQQMKYFFDASFNSAERTEPVLPLYNVNNPYTCNLPLDYSASCPTKKYPFGPTVLLNLKEDYAESIVHYTDSIDGGDKTFLLQSIQNEDPSVIYNLLSPLTGRLSNEVLIAVLNESPRIPYGMTNDLLIQNAPLSNDVKEVLLSSSLPEYYKTPLLSLSGSSMFNQLMSELAFYQHEVSLIDQEIYKRVMEDSSIINKLDALSEMILNDLPEEEKLRFLIEFHMANQQQVSSDSLLNQYSTNFDNQVYSEFQNLLIDKLNTPGKILAVISDSVVSNTLVNLITTNPNTREAQIAVKLFEFLLNQEVYSNIDEINYLKSMSAIMEKLNETHELPLTVFPNPTTDIISFNLGLDEKDAANIEIYNMDGKIVFQGELKASQTFLDVKNYEKGLYIMNVTYPNGYVKKTQFTKV
jgi:hypothetical protein